VIEAFSLDAAQFQLYETEGLYSLAIDATRLPQNVSQVRRAAERDRETLISFYRDYNIEALNETDESAALDDAKRSLMGRYNDARQFVLELNDVIVAASAFNAVVPPFVQIGGVWTPPLMRSRGYARACVAGSLAIARGEGFTHAVLFTGDDNLAAIRSYRALGFQRMGDFFVGVLREPYTLRELNNLNAAP
jgi:uncharacterized protein